MAYRIKSTWKAKIIVDEGKPESEIVVEFKHAPRNAQIKKEVAAAEGQEEKRDAVQDTIDAIVSIHGIENEHGDPIEPRDLLDCVDNKLLAAVVFAYARGPSKFYDLDSNEKKFIGIE